MSFYLVIDRDTLKWGGLESVSSTYAYISMSTAYSHIADDGNITQPMGLWILGSSIKAHYCAGYLRRRAIWRDEEFCSYSLEYGVTIVVYTNDKLYVYSNGSRTYKTMDLTEGFVYKVNATDYDIQRSIRGYNPKHWNNYNTDYMLV